MIGLLAKKAVEAGLNVEPYIKTSLSPGSGVVTYYLEESGVIPYLTKLGFDIVGYGCMTCIGNSGPLPDAIVETIEKVRYSRISLKFLKNINLADFLFFNENKIPKNKNNFINCHIKQVVEKINIFYKN